MNKPLLFLCSSPHALEIESLYYLKDLGKVLNLSDERLTDLDIQRFIDNHFIICNMNDSNEVQKLRFIPREGVVTICVLRKYESSSEPWVLKANADFILKDLSFVKDCKRHEELVNFIKHLARMKSPDSNFKFYLKKVLGFLGCLKERD